MQKHVWKWRFHGQRNDSTPNPSGEIDYYNELDLVLLFPTMITGENISCSERLPQIIRIHILEVIFKSFIGV